MEVVGRYLLLAPADNSPYWWVMETVEKGTSFPTREAALAWIAAQAAQAAQDET